ncbi:MAG: carbon-nitrogen hydrolase family protein [Chloroflexi bacterium]|nr:carbon-nitrogen hydrolase family protein [Chloroflexota bacterium]
MKKMLNVALLQLIPHGDDLDANRAKGDAYCRRAKAMGADIALFPELWSIGFTFKRPEETNRPPSDQANRSDGHRGPNGARDMHEVDAAEAIDEDLWRAPELWRPGEAAPDAGLRDALAAWQALAVPRDGPFVTHFRRLARELDMAIAIAYLEQWDGPPRNSMSLIDRHGEIVLTYAKVHTCDFDQPEASTTPGDGFYVCDLDTAQGTVKIGAMICFDREFPESARVLMLKGAEIILTPNACTLEQHRLRQFATRACENAVGVALANYAAPQNNGHSVAFHPVAFDARGSRETLVIKAGEAEGVYLARFDLDEIRAWRRRDGWDTPFRRPQHYGILTAPDVEAHFIRVNAAGQRWDRTRRQT